MSSNSPERFSIKRVSAVIVTRGDVDLGPVLDSLRQHFSDIVVWDNSARLASEGESLGVYGRYAAIPEAKHPVIYTQDDDCIVDAAAVLSQYESGKVICNMSEAKREEYRHLAPGTGLVGWGACFDAGLSGVLTRYIDRYGKDDIFLRECDRVFTALNFLKFVDVSFSNLSWASSSSRMGSERRHLADLAEITRRIKTLDTADARLATV